MFGVTITDAVDKEIALQIMLKKALEKSWDEYVKVYNEMVLD